MAPIVAGVSIWHRGRTTESNAKRPALVPLFVVGFLAAVTLRTTAIVPEVLLDLGSRLSIYALATGMVGLGTSVSFAALRRLGLKPLALGAVAWLIVGSVSLGAIIALGI